MFSYPYRVPYCVPYWSRKSVEAIGRCILTGHVVQGHHINKLAQILGARLGVSNVILCHSGRMALELGLKAVDVRPGDQVILPSYACSGVIEPVIAVGAVPVLADVGDDLNLTPSNVLAALTPRTRAVIVAHLSGNPARIDEIHDMCRGRGIAIIDDAAQALGGELDGRPLGTLGDVGVLSFGNGKVCFGVGGGVLLSRSSQLLDRAASFRLDTPDYGPTCLRALSILVWRRWRRWTLPFQMIRWRMTKARQSIGQPPGILSMANLQAAVALTLIETLNENVTKRRARVGIYQKNLKGKSGLSLLVHRPGSACLNQPLILNKDQHGIAAIQEAMARHGYEIGDGYLPLHRMGSFKKFASVPTPHSDDIFQRVLELPSEPTIALEEIRRLCSLLNETSHTSPLVIRR